MAAGNVRKEKDMSGCVELLVWVDGEKMLQQSQKEQLARGLKESSVQEQTGTTQEPGRSQAGRELEGVVN